MAGRRSTGDGLVQTFRSLLVTLVVLSSGLTAAYAGASLAVVAGAALAGLVVGILVVAIALPAASENEEPDPRLRWED
jgi:membrane associated rhomboid family serine protease